MDNTLKLNEWLEAQNKNIQGDLLLEVENVMNKINKEFNPYVEIHKNIITNKQIIIKIYNNKINL